MKLGELANQVGALLEGDPECEIDSVSTLQSASHGQIAFLANSKYRRYLPGTKAGAVILKQEELAQCPTSALVSDNPYLTYARVASLLNPNSDASSGIDPSAMVADDCQLEEGVTVGPHAVIESGVRLGAGAVVGAGCVIGRQSEIGAGSRLYPNVSVYHGVKIGTNAIIHSGVVIGSDGFGMANDQGRWVKVPQLGGVVIGNDVEIGANTTIDRGALEDTVIEDGVKLDNQIQVAHNVRIGAHTAIAGCVGIAGSTQIGRRCQIGGGVGIVGHLTIADDVYVTAMSLVTGNINKPGLYSSGTPLEPNSAWQKNAVRFRQLDDMARRLKEIERRISEQ